MKDLFAFHPPLSFRVLPHMCTHEIWPDSADLDFLHSRLNFLSFEPPSLLAPIDSYNVYPFLTLPTALFTVRGKSLSASNSPLPKIGPLFQTLTGESTACRCLPVIPDSPSPLLRPLLLLPLSHGILTIAPLSFLESPILDSMRLPPLFSSSTAPFSSPTGFRFV